MRFRYKCDIVAAACDALTRGRVDKAAAVIETHYPFIATQRPNLIKRRPKVLKRSDDEAMTKRRVTVDPSKEDPASLPAGSSLLCHSDCSCETLTGRDWPDYGRSVVGRRRLTASLKVSR
jgi:hypothetical protein